MRRKELLPKMMKAREEGKIAYLSFDKLVIIIKRRTLLMPVYTELCYEHDIYTECLLYNDLPTQ